MNAANPSFSQLAIRYASYPTIMGSTAFVLLILVGDGLPYLPTVPIVVAAALLAVAMLERRLPFHREWLHDHRDAACDATHAIVNLATLLSVHWFITLLPSQWLASSVWPTDWPLVAQALLVGLVLDLSLYSVHWFSHRYAWLWKFHAIHHSSERLYWLNGERRHPLHAMMMAGPGLLIVVLLGAPSLAVGVWLGVLAVHLAFQHSNLDYRVGPLRYLVGAAEVHRWHHKREYEDAQVNFGEFWMIWDHAFGTFKLPRQALGATDVGLSDRAFPMRYAAQLVYPLTRRDPDAELIAQRRLQAASIAFVRECRVARVHEDARDLPTAWRAHELAHIIGQPYLRLHLLSHWQMVGLAWRTGNTAECRAQAVRLILTPLAHLTGRTPLNNVGTRRVGLLDQGSWPTELEPMTFQRREAKG
jgi:sterol desaturase/sphingolipid hydroxylase (fatty acid hydroxylase superfamily)|uniref:sterol desaturase family protein n=1 Tax=uncultured Acidovorax sp. TaxID=158751 RepID=UPI0009E75E92|nr:sterol desaturase family protein [uncultured Acidovorax sp.]